MFVTLSVDCSHSFPSLTLLQRGRLPNTGYQKTQELWLGLGQTTAAC